MRLGDVAIVRSGLVLSRKQARKVTKYRYKLLTLRSVNPGGYINIESTDIYDAIEPLNKDYLSQIGDVVIRLSAPYTAVLIDSETAGIVVSSNFVIVRLNTSFILPDYLYWLLNTPNVRRDIFKNTSSNMLGAVKPLYFLDFEMSHISLENQKIIAKMNLLAHRECQLLNKLVLEKEKYYSHTINEMQKKMKGGTCNDN